MTSASQPWKAVWRFTTSAGVTYGTVDADVFEVVRTTVTRAAEASLSGLPEVEADAMDDFWNMFIASLELHAERRARTSGRWVYCDDLWADIAIGCAS